MFDDTDQAIQAQLKSDHACSSLSLGRIARIEDNSGRKEFRGEGFEVRSDAHGAIRAKRGLLITTEARNNARAHILDSGETAERLNEARELHESGAELAQKNHVQSPADQAHVAAALKAQHDEIKGSARPNPQTGEFPEFTAPHLVLASPAGIETTSQFSTHIASGEHTAITSGKHTSITSGDSFLATAMEAIKLLAVEKGIKAVAAQADIDIQALRTCINLTAKDQITLRADKIRIEATSELLLNGGGSFTRYRSGSVVSGTTGAHTRHAANHSLTGPDEKPVGPLISTPPYQAQYVLRSEVDGSPLFGQAYKLRLPAGREVTGVTNDQGETMKVFTSDASDVHLAAHKPKKRQKESWQMAGGGVPQIVADYTEVGNTEEDENEDDDPQA